jgi:Flp pilus assembly protein TadG
MKRFIRERGQSLVELGVSLVILLYLLSGAAEFGVLFFQYVQLRDAAQEGALYGSMNPVNAVPIEQRVRAASSSPIDLSDVSKVTVAVTAKDKTTNATKTLASACEGDGIVVEVSYTHRIFMPFIPQLIGRTSIPLTADVTDTVLTPVCP